MCRSPIFINKNVGKIAALKKMYLVLLDVLKRNFVFEH